MPGTPHPAATPIAPPFTVTNLNNQVQALVDTSYAWLRAEWLQMLIALGIGAVSVIALLAARALGHRLCNRDTAGTGWWTVIGRAVTRTSFFFILMLAVVLVARIPSPPNNVLRVISALFTIASAFQAAIWAREIILGAVLLTTAPSDYHGETLGTRIR